MNKARGLFVFLLLVIPVAISCAGMQTVRIGTEGAYPPFGYLNDAGELEGFEIDLGNELLQSRPAEMPVADQRLGNDNSQSPG